MDSEISINSLNAICYHIEPVMSRIIFFVALRVCFLLLSKTRVKIEA